MGLLVWLPLNGNLVNQGLADITITNSGATVNSNGKIGQCYRFEINSQGTTMTKYLTLDKKCCDLFNDGDSFSYCCWVKVVNYASTGASGFGGCVKYLSESSTVNGTTVKGGGFGFLLNTSGKATAYANPFEGSKSVSVGTIPLNTWTHICMTYDKETMRLSTYLNGNYVTSSACASNWGSNGTYFVFGRGSQGGCNYNSENYQNDIRIYDHCLSKKEVHDIAQGLVLHYKLDDNTIEASQNLVSYPSIEYELENVGWDESKHQGALKIRNWNTGYNSGVADPTHGYHGCWKIIDGEFTIVLTDINSDISQTHRWIAMWGGLANQNINEWQNRTYTISFDARADVDNKYISSGLYYKKTSDGSYSFHDTLETIVLSKKWKRYSFTRTTTTVYSLSSIFIYGHNGTVEGTSYIKNIQLEFNDHATEYVGITGSRQKGFIVDSSGYGNNGTMSGDLSIINDSPRYSVSTQFGSSKYISPSLWPSFLTNEVTISMWVKLDQLPPSSPGRTMIYSAWYGFSCEINSSGKTYFRTYLSNSGTIDSPQGTIGVGEWVHWVGVKSSAGISLYLNGILIGTTSNTNNFNWSSNQSNKIAAYSNSYFTYGKISDLRLYATALSEQDINDLYNMAGYVDNLGDLECYSFDEQTENLFDIDDFKKNLISTSANIHYADRNGEQAVAIQPNWFYSNSIYYSIISPEKFLPNTQYKFDIWIDTDNVISGGSNVAAGLRIYYEGGSSESLTKTGNQANPKGWQHISFISNKNTTISKVGVYYHTSIPGYYRWDSTITPMISTSQIQKNGIYATGQFRENTNIAQICQGDHFDANHFIEI